MGWMLCDGRTLSVADYGLLFGVIGYTFAIDLSGSSSFKLPDYRGAVPGMAGQPSYSNDSSNINPYSFARGDYVGEQRHRLNIDEMPAHTHGSNNVSGNSNGNGYTTLNGNHTHTATDNGHTHPYGTYSGNVDAAVSLTTNHTVANNGVTSNTDEGFADIVIGISGEHTHQIFNTGGSNFHCNMQPTLFGGNMFIYSGKNMQAYFPYTWVGSTPGYSNNVPTTPGNVLIF